MNVNYYAEYAHVFDYFSNPEFFPLNKNFMLQVVAPRLSPTASVVDVGAGTGLFTAELLQQIPTAQITIIEPSPDMRPIAQQRLGDRIRYLDKIIDKCLPELPLQDAFIFQRSLYAIYENEAHCRKIFYQLNKKIKLNGYIFILEFKERIDIQALKDHVFSIVKDKSDEARIEFSNNWPVFEAALKRFDGYVTSGEFHIFTTPELNDLLNSAGFARVPETMDFCHVYQKVYNCHAPYWLHETMRKLSPH